MSSYSDSIRYLYGLQTRGMKFGLRGIQTLLNATGNPQEEFSSVHIAGTNGKGSTAAMIAAMLTAAGFKIGLYTSPHVVDFSERIRINGKPIERHNVVSILRKLKPLVEKHKTTFFETVTAIAFHYFAKEKVDIAVVETGLGGRLDATNVLQPLVSVITNIGLEHTEILGNSISKIAYEKAGIIKSRVPCVIGVASPLALKRIKEIARKQSSPVIHDRAKIKIKTSDLEKTILDTGDLKGLRLSLAGSHQTRNASLAIQTLQQLTKTNKLYIPNLAIRRGLADVRKYSGLQSRLSMVKRRPQVIVDVAHNPDAIHALVNSLKDLQSQDLLLVFGVSEDKDYLRMAKLLKPIIDRVIAVSAKTYRARSTQDLTEVFTDLRVPVESEATVRLGVERAMRLARSGQSILVTGSHFVVGETMAFLQGKKYLTINQ